MKRILLTLIIVALFSCNEQRRENQAQKSEKLTVITVNYPLYYFADRIGGDLLNLQYPVPEGLDPAYWKPDEEALNRYQTADLILANGANYAKWMENVSLPSSRIINTSDAFEKDLIPLSTGAAHSHGPEGEHEPTGYAFTTWLNFKLAVKQAQSVRDILIVKLPEQKELLDKNFNALKNDLRGLDKEMANKTLGLKEVNLLGSHPVYQYLSKGYNLNIQSLHFEPDEMPTEKQWKDLSKLTNQSKTNVMLWEDAPLQEIESEILDSGIDVKVFNPCGNMPSDGDFLIIMRDNIKNLKMTE